jgi:hypothetical protein
MPVLSRHCREAHEIVPSVPGNEPVAIVLDLVDPCRPAGSLLGARWQAGG